MNFLDALFLTRVKYVLIVRKLFSNSLSFPYGYHFARHKGNNFYKKCKKHIILESNQECA